LARLAEAARAPEVVRSVVNCSLPGNQNGGDLVWHVQYPDRAAYDRSLASSAWRDVEGLLADASVVGEESVGYEAGPIGVWRPDLSAGIFRVLLLSVLTGRRRPSWSGSRPSCRRCRATFLRSATGSLAASPARRARDRGRTCGSRSTRMSPACTGRTCGIRTIGAISIDGLILKAPIR
jgi:hypothetical protein